MNKGSKVLKLIGLEKERQNDTLMLIPSENYTYPEVRFAVGSVLMHKYSEGYPFKRYYQGNKYVDEIETYAIDLAKKVFNTPHANVQPYSGSPANAAVYFGLLKEKDTIMGLSLSSGGHLTHGHPKITFSGKYFNSIQYGVDDNGFIDYENLSKLAKKYKPKLIVAGLTSYPRILDWSKFSLVAESVGAILLADISHIAGLVAGGEHPSPVKYAHVITTTTHKTLRGPRGAIIMVTQKGLDKDPNMGVKVDRAVFPGFQGGPHNNQTAGIAIALENALKPDFKRYTRQTVKNAKFLGIELAKYGFSLVTEGTDNHLLLIDLRNKNTTGKLLATALEEAGIIVNYNAVPKDPNPPMNPSGIRIGTPAVTVRKMQMGEMKLIAKFINKSVENLNNKNVLKQVAREVKDLCNKFPVDLN